MCCLVSELESDPHSALLQTEVEQPLPARPRHGQQQQPRLPRRPEPQGDVLHLTTLLLASVHTDVVLTVKLNS